MSERIKGQCLCGAVAFDIGSEFYVDACHCQMCRRWGGGPFIGLDIRDGDVRFEKDEALSWYESSAWAKRGFCATCGSSLFYRLKENEDFWAIATGSLDLPAGVMIGKEIFIDEKPDFYDLAGGRPRLTGEEFLATLQGNADD